MPEYSLRVKLAVQLNCAIGNLNRPLNPGGDAKRRRRAGFVPTPPRWCMHISGEWICRTHWSLNDKTTTQSRCFDLKQARFAAVLHAPPYAYGTMEEHWRRTSWLTKRNVNSTLRSSTFRMSLVNYGTKLILKLHQDHIGGSCSTCKEKDRGRPEPITNVWSSIGAGAGLHGRFRRWLAWLSLAAFLTVVAISYTLGMDICAVHDSAPLTVEEKKLLKDLSGPVQKRRTTGTVGAQRVATLVTTYYQLPSKRRPCVYHTWMENFFPKLNTPIHLFTDNRSLRGFPGFSRVLLKRERRFPGLFLVEPLEINSTTTAHSLGSLLAAQQHRDPELRRGHNYHLYLVWLIKAEILSLAVSSNVFQTEWFIYCDSGSLRSSHSFHHWPSPERLGHLDKKRVLVELVSPMPQRFTSASSHATKSWLSQGPKNCSLIYKDHVAGGFIGVNSLHGTAEVLFSRVLETAKFLAGKGHLIVKDQVTYNTLFFLYPELFTGVPAPRNALGGPQWFYMYPWLASETERGNIPLLQPVVRN